MKDILALLLLLMLVSNTFLLLGGNDTDDPTGRRSHLIVYTDYGTGCQYVGTTLGGISPRLGTDGRPVCGHRP